MKPLLPKSRFEKLMELVRPPKCETKWIEVAEMEFALSDDQRKKLEEAKSFAERYRTNTLTEAEKDIVGRQSMAEFTRATSNTYYSGGWIGKRKY